VLTPTSGKFWKNLIHCENKSDQNIFINKNYYYLAKLAYERLFLLQLHKKLISFEKTFSHHFVFKFCTVFSEKATIFVTFYNNSSSFEFFSRKILKFFLPEKSTF